MDDHVYYFVWQYGEYDRDNFLQEWKSGKYKKISECPSYGQVKLCCDICNMIAKRGASAGLQSDNTPSEIIEDLL